MKQTRKRLGDLLVGAGLITEDQLQLTLTEKDQGQKLGDALLQRGYLSEQQLIEVLEVQLGIPHISLYNYPFEKKSTLTCSKRSSQTQSVNPD